MRQGISTAFPARRHELIARSRRSLPVFLPHLPALIGLATGLLILGPAMARGFVLRVDMLAMPDPPLKGALLGLSASAPRAVPSDLALTLLSAVLPGDVAQKLLLVGIFVIGASGVGVLVRPLPLAARLSAAFFFDWNPYVAERLLIGHWALLYGYASMPWIVWACGRVRGVRDRPTWRRITAAILPAALGGFAAMLVAAIIIAGVSVVRRSWRTALLGGTAWLLWALPWLVPSLLNQGSLTGDPDGADAFASRADSPFGTFGSLLMLGGVWNRDSVPSHYADAPLVAARVVLTAVALAGVAFQWSRYPVRGRRTVTVLLPPAMIGLLIASVATSKPGLVELRKAIKVWPAAGVFRDAQQFVAPLALLEAVGLGAAVAALLASARLRGQGGRVYVATAVLLPFIALPQLAWGVGGELRPVRYPADWAAVRAIVDHDSQPGAVLVLPWSAYRLYDWNPSSVLLDPATKAFRRRVVADDALVVGTTSVAGEDPVAHQVSEILSTSAGRLTAADCARLGVRYVLLEQPPPAIPPVAGLTEVFTGTELTLYRISG